MVHKKLIRTIVVATVTVTMGAGCSTINPYTRDTEVSKATKGAGIGAATGAIIGAVAGGGKAKGILIGAGIGAATGGAAGYYMDQQEALLRQQLEGTGVSVSRSGDRIVLNMPGNVTFKTDSSDLRPQFFEVLNSVALVLKKFEDTTIEVAGHTDSTGPVAYNQKLSERRAQSVSRYLHAQGIDEGRFWTIGYGETRPIASNDTAEGRQRNRRVELQIVPIEA